MIYKTTLSRSNIISHQLLNAFDKQADSADILQGVRKLRKGRPQTRTILFPSPKNEGKFIACDGSLEPEMALALELNPSVKCYRGQPIELPGPNGKDIVPDFAFDLGDGFGIIDIKPKARLKSPRVKERMQHIRKILADARIPHYILTEEELCQEPFHQIRHQLRKGIGNKYSPLNYQQLINCFKNKTTSVEHLRNNVISMGLNPNIIEAAAANEILNFTINTPWGNHTQLGVNHDNTTITTANWGTVRDICPSF